MSNITFLQLARDGQQKNRQTHLANKQIATLMAKQILTFSELEHCIGHFCVVVIAHYRTNSDKRGAVSGLFLRLLTTVEELYT